LQTQAAFATLANLQESMLRKYALAMVVVVVVVGPGLAKFLAQAL